MVLSDKREKEVQRFVPLVDFLGIFLGESCEIVLHRVGERDSSILAIANSEDVSGRQVGAPLTDLALKFVMDREYQRRDWVMGYTTLGKDGIPLHSATYFIRDEDGDLAGMLCLNMKISELVKARDIIDKMINHFTKKAPSTKGDLSLTESFSSSVEDLTENIIRQVVQEATVPPERMSPDEKIELVRTLHDRGVFLLKGSVHSVARHLAASEPTIYRYLQKVSSGS